MSEIPALLQYGAMGLLGLVLVGLYMLAKMMVGIIQSFLNRFAASFDDLVATVKGIVPAITEMKSDLREDIRNSPDRREQ